MPLNVCAPLFFILSMRVTLMSGGFARARNKEQRTKTKYFFPLSVILSSAQRILGPTTYALTSIPPNYSKAIYSQKGDLQAQPIYKGSARPFLTTLW